MGGMFGNPITATDTMLTKRRSEQLYQRRMEALNSARQNVINNLLNMPPVTFDSFIWSGDDSFIAELRSEISDWLELD